MQDSFHKYYFFRFFLPLASKVFIFIPQIVSGSHDSTMRIWDIGEGRCTQILTGHDKSVRSIVVHPEE